MFCLHECLHTCGLVMESQWQRHWDWTCQCNETPWCCCTFGPNYISQWPQRELGRRPFVSSRSPGNRGSSFPGPFPLRLDSVNLRSEGLEENPEASGQKRNLPAVGSAGEEWAGEWPARISRTLVIRYSGCPRNRTVLATVWRDCHLMCESTLWQGASESTSGTFLFTHPVHGRAASLWLERETVVRDASLWHPNVWELGV